MGEKSLGIIETLGLVPAIEAADTALKTADVTLESMEMAGAGLVAIMMRGDVSSVKASVDAGKDAAERLGQVVSTTVIARPAEGLEQLSGAEHENCNDSVKQDACPVETTEEVNIEFSKAEQLQEMSVVVLRNIARELDGFTMPRKEIRSARKSNLIESILKYYQERGVDHG